MQELTLPIYNTAGKQVDSVKLDPEVFNGIIHTASIYQVANAYRANQRQGLAATKTRGEVSGGGKKPWKQKGTGRARHGSNRSPLWRHGGAVFGPHPRDYSYSLPQKIKALALKSSLNAKVKENNLIVLDKMSLESLKTKEANRIFINLKVSADKKKAPKTLLLLEGIDLRLKRALRNIAFLNFNLAKNTHAYEVLASKKLVITQEGLRELTARLKG